MKKIVSLFILIVSQLIFSQKIMLDEGQYIEIRKKSIKIGKKISSCKEYKSLIFTSLINSTNNKPVDINAFSLLDVENKIRYRPIKYESHGGKSVVGFQHSSESYLKDKIVDKNGKPYKLLPKYDPTVTDSFEEFNFEGFTNCETPLDFGSNRRHSVSELFSENHRLVSVVYFPESKWDIFNCQFQFSIFIEGKTPKLEFYYKKKMISEIEYK